MQLRNNINDSFAKCQWKIFEYKLLRFWLFSSLFPKDILVGIQENTPPLQHQRIQYSFLWISSIMVVFISNKNLPCPFAFVIRKSYPERLGFLLDAPSKAIYRIPIYGRIYFSPELLVSFLVLVPLLVAWYYY